MAPDDYASAGGGGKLKLKGKASEGRVEKKKKKKEKKEKEKEKALKKREEGEEAEAPPDEKQGDAKEKEDTEDGAGTVSGPKTEAEKKYDEIRRRRVCLSLSLSPSLFASLFPKTDYCSCMTASIEKGLRRIRSVWRS